MDKKKQHLKHLIFNDALCVDDCNMGHNASDRASMYEIWLEDVQASDFDERYERGEVRYAKAHNGCPEELVAITGYKVEDNIIKDLDEYTDEIVEKAYSMVMAQLGE
jgi:hypothetical protein